MRQTLYIKEMGLQEASSPPKDADHRTVSQSHLGSDRETRPWGRKLRTEKSAPCSPLQFPHRRQLALAIGSALVKSGQVHPKMSQNNHLPTAFGGDIVCSPGHPAHLSFRNTLRLCSHLCLSFSSAPSTTSKPAPQEGSCFPCVPPTASHAGQGIQ